MSVAWNQISTAQQTQFLQAAGLNALPEPVSLNPSQWNALVGIVGEDKAQAVRKGGQPASPSAPQLDPPKMSGDWSTVMAKIAEIRMQLSELQIKVSSEGIKSTKDNMAEANKIEQQKMKDSIEKMQKAQTTGLLGKILGWIGAVAGLIGAAIATVATGGAAAPVLAVAVLGMAVMVLQETGAMEKIVDFLAENPMLLMAVFGPVIGGTLGALIESGVIDQDKAKMAIQVALSVALLVVNIAAMAFSGGSSVAGIAAQVARITGIATSIGSGALGIVEAKQSFDAARIQADAKEIQAWLIKLQQMLSEESDRLKEIMDKLTSGVSEVSDMLSDIADSHNSIFSSMGA